MAARAAARVKWAEAARAAVVTVAVAMVVEEKEAAVTVVVEMVAAVMVVAAMEKSMASTRGSLQYGACVLALAASVSDSCQQPLDNERRRAPQPRERSD